MSLLRQGASSLSRHCQARQLSNKLLESTRNEQCWNHATARMITVRLLSGTQHDPQGGHRNDENGNAHRTHHDNAGDREDGLDNRNYREAPTDKNVALSFSPPRSMTPFFSTAWIPPPHSPVLSRRNDDRDKETLDLQDENDIAPSSLASAENKRWSSSRHSLWSPPSIIRVGEIDNDDDGAGKGPGQPSGLDEEDGVGGAVGDENQVADVGGYCLHDGPLLVTPSQGQLLRDQDEAEWLEVKVHALLSRDEIAYCLRMLGLTGVVAIMDSKDKPRMGGGTAGMIIATALTLHQLRSAADGLVRQLRRRRLHEVGVVGAELGPEGSSSSLRDAHESWYVVDCQNYVVHLMDEPTRKALRLEDLWSGKDGLHRLDLLDENAVDEYVSQNPVPDEYSRRVMSYEGGNADEVLRQLEKIRWSVPHTPVTTSSRKAKGNRKGRRRRGSQ